MKITTQSDKNSPARQLRVTLGIQIPTGKPVADPVRWQCRPLGVPGANRSAVPASLPEALSGAHRVPCRWLASFLLLLLAFTVSPAFAATRIWTGAHAFGNNWSRNANWDTVAPVDGDTVVFPAGAARLNNDNDIAGLQLAVIRFIGAGGGYTLGGNQIRLSDRIVSENTAGANTVDLARITLDAGARFVVQQAGVTLTIDSDVALNGNDLAANPTGILVLRGVVSGTGNINKNSDSILTLSGAAANTFTGDVFVNEGSLFLGKSSGLAVPHRLVIGDGAGGAQSDIAANVGSDQVNEVTVNASGLWNLGNFTEVLSDLVLNGGGDVQTAAAGNLRLAIGADVTVTSSLAGIQDASHISGNLELLLGTHVFTIGEGSTFGADGSDLIIDAVVSGLGGITKEGPGDLLLDGNNTFAAQVQVNAGQLRLGSSDALGSTFSGTFVNNDAGLQVNGGVSIGAEKLTLDSTGRSGSLNAFPPLNGLGTSSWSGDVTLAQDTRIGVASGGNFTISGTIDGTGGLTKEQPGTLRIAGNAAHNTYAGTTFVNAGTLELDKGTIGGVVAVPGRLVIGDGLGGIDADVVRQRKNSQVNQVTINGSGLWDLQSNTEEVSELVFNEGGRVTTTTTGLLRLGIGADVIVNAQTNSHLIRSEISGRLELLLGSHTFQVSEGLQDTGDSVELFIDADISGIGAIRKTGEGELALYGDNSFAGTVTVDAGSLWAAHSHAFGSTLSGTRVNNDGSLKVFLDVAITNESLTLDSVGQARFAAHPLHGGSGSNSWSGPITLLRDAIISVQAGATLNLSGAISGPGGVTKEDVGTLLYSGEDSNTYTGVTRVNTGRLELNKVNPTGPVDAIVGALIIGDDVGGANADVVACVAIGQMDIQSAVTVNSSGRFEARSELFGSLAGSGRVVNDIALSVGWNNDSTTFDGVISGAGSFSKRGSGVMTLNGNNTYTGVTSLVEGGLTVNGQQPSSDVTAGSNTTLAGRGRVGNVTAVNNGGTLSPGTSPGRLTTDDLQFVSGSTYRVELDGPVPADSHDQVKVNGTVDLAQASLNAVLRFAPTLGQSLVIIDNDGTDVVTDRFAGLQQGDTITLNQIPFVISYRGGDGNDVTLTATNTSISVLSTRIEAGNGNGFIEPNECNHLFIALMNETTGPLSVSRVVLDSVTPGVVVTQPFSSYANFPALGIRSNGVPFQFTTAPDFVCGRLIEFQLTLTVSGGGTFTIPIVVPSGSAGAPVLFNHPANLALADSALTSSTITVSGAEPYVGKVAVSLHITHPSAGDLVLRLRSPSGNTVRLAGNLGGAIDNYGNGCGSQVERTTFDDAAPVRIAAGAAPFVGSFTPEQPLAAFLGENPNGDWTLLINDTVAGDAGELRCWSLHISPPDCGDGGGACESCTPLLTGSFTGTGPIAAQRLVMDGVPSGCGNPKACPGTTVGLPRSYRTHSITNNGPATCMSVALTERCPGPTNHFHVAAYLGNFDPANPCANYLGDSGGGLLGAANHFAFQAPADAVIVLVVNQLTAQTGCELYTLRLHGLPCPPPTLHIAKTANPGEVRLFWSTAYPDFDLQRTPNLNGAAPYPFVNVPITPTVVNGDYSVTNSTSGRDGYYRLRKP